MNAAVAWLECSHRRRPVAAHRAGGRAIPGYRGGRITLQQTSETLAQLAQHVDETMQRLNAPLSPQDRAAIAQILENLSRRSRRANGLVAKADATLGATSARTWSSSPGGLTGCSRAATTSRAPPRRRYAPRPIRSAPPAACETRSR